MAGDDYTTWFAELKELAKNNPGFIDIKTYRADDGERLTAVRWRDAETSREWSHNVRHLEAKRLAREKWYDYFEIQVSEVIRTSRFDRDQPDEALKGGASAFTVTR
jgi:heme-degrading monooxygenase HmoA